MALHVFQPLPMDVVEINPFKLIGKDWALVTAGSKQKYNTMTVSWGGVGVLWGKNVATIYIRDSRYTKELIDDGDFFSVSFFDGADKDALNYCGSHSGRNEDKFKAAGLTPAFRHSIPYPGEASFVLLCRKMAAVPITEDTFIDPDIKDKWYKDGDMHTMYIGEIIDVIAR